MRIRSIIISLFTIMALPIVAYGQNKSIKATRVGDRIDVVVGDKFFTSYRFAADEKYPFFFPVNGPLSGGGVTSMRNGVYPHHSSLFFGCDRVNGGNYWQEGLERRQIVSLGPRITETDGEKVIIEDECIWKRPDATSPVIDRRVICISSPHKGLYQIDFDVEMEMLQDVTILKTNHSLFSARIDPDLTVDNGGTMVNSEGGAMQKGTFGVKSAWIDCFGTRKKGVEGIAIMQHPSNKWFPSPWFTRDYGFMSPTPMYWPDNDKSTELKKGEVINLRYRVLVHEGDTDAADIKGLFEAYSQE